MDPNENLKEQRRIARRLLALDRTLVEISADASRLAELVEALDQWIMKSGHAPSYWGVKIQNEAYEAGYARAKADFKPKPKGDFGDFSLRVHGICHCGAHGPLTSDGFCEACAS